MHGAIPRGAGAHGAAGAQPEIDSNANPQTWDWRPIETRDKLKRNQLERKCTDPAWAVIFILAILATIGFGIYGITTLDWTSENEDFAFGQSITNMILGVVVASSLGIIFAWIWTCILKSCAGSMVKISIYVYLGLYVLGALVGFIAGGVAVGLVFCIPLLFQLLYFWCVWHRIPLAEATMTIAVMRLRKYSNVMWIAVAACVLTMGWIVMCIFGYIGASKMFEIKEDGGKFGMIVLFILFLYWGVLFISYAVHAICAGIMGTWYFATSRKRTTCDAVSRAFTTSFGSISFASFIVAVIRTMEKIAAMFEKSARDNDNGGAAIVACCIRCILEILGDIVKYLNGLAIVRVAVYGESYWTAAKRTMNMIKYRGFEVVINDDLSGMVVWLGCCICFALTIPCMFAYYAIVFSGDAKYEGGNENHGLLVLALAFCALLIPIQILTTLQSFVQSLYVLWADDPQALDDTHPEESRMLKNAVYGHANYQMRYDDRYIIVQGAAHT